MEAWKRNLLKSWRRRRAARHRRLEREAKREAIPYMMQGEKSWTDAHQRMTEARARADYHAARAKELDR